MRKPFTLDVDTLTVDSFVAVEPVMVPGVLLDVETGCVSGCTQCPGDSAFMDCAGAVLAAEIR